MEQSSNSQSEIDKKIISSWISQLNIDYVHGTGWVEVNQRNSAITQGSRTFVNQQYPDDPQRRTDFLDGVAFGLLAEAHTTDIAEIKKLFAESFESL